MFVEQRGGKCELCGYDKNYAALTFHHTDPSVKERGLASGIMASNSLETMQREITKCQLLCYNCHAELHHPRLRKESYSPDISS